MGKGKTDFATRILSLSKHYVLFQEDVESRNAGEMRYYHG